MLYKNQIDTYKFHNSLSEKSKAYLRTCMDYASTEEDQMMIRIADFCLANRSRMFSLSDNYFWVDRGAPIGYINVNIKNDSNGKSVNHRVKLDEEPGRTIVKLAQTFSDLIKELRYKSSNGKF